MLADRSGYGKSKQLKEEYVTWLLATGQQEKAGQVKQEDGQLIEAVELYMVAGLPATAARLVLKLRKFGLFECGVK